MSFWWKIPAKGHRCVNTSSLTDSDNFGAEAEGQEEQRKLVWWIFLEIVIKALRKSTQELWEKVIPIGMRLTVD